MRRWLWMTGGLAVWAVHFTGVYALASLADVVASADDVAWRRAGMAFSLACLAACALLFAQAWRTTRRDEVRELGRDLSLLSAGVGGVAVSWQTIPLFVGY